MLLEERWWELKMVASLLWTNATNNSSLNKVSGDALNKLLIKNYIPEFLREITLKLDQ